MSVVMLRSSNRLSKAAKQHRCTYCGEAIEPGTTYHFWKTIDEGRWFTNKMHRECVLDMDEIGEYVPYDNERPRLI